MKGKIDKAMWHCYRQLYAHANPPANFDELVEKAKINDRGQKEIDFMSYELDEDVFEEILNQTMKDFKIPKHQRQPFKIAIYLGCSPKTKKNEDK